MIQWISDIWKNIDDDLLTNSFDYCGITSQNKLHSILQLTFNANLRFGGIVETNVKADDDEQIKCRYSHSNF